MKNSAWIVLLVLLFSGCGGADKDQGGAPNAEASGATAGEKAAADASMSLSEARRGFKTKLVPNGEPANPAPEPPSGMFRLVHYEAPSGKLAAYLSPDPGDGKKRPAIVWITGGDCNSIGDVWAEAPPENDQTGSAYRNAGIIMMFPSLRGGNDNPGQREGFLGEVDDVAAAAAYLGGLAYVDPAKIYLGGHSTGGTLVMLVAESTDRFRAAFAFGAADDAGGYDAKFLPFDTANAREIELRSPGRWLASVRSPLWVFEGSARPGNINALRAMGRASTNPWIRFLPVEGLDHFSVLAPLNKLIAAKILQDDGPTTNITFAAEELKKATGKAPSPDVNP